MSDNKEIITLKNERFEFLVNIIEYLFLNNPIQLF